jgi:chorismate-pyruvate lyase
MTTGPRLPDLFALFDEPPPSHADVPADEVPEPYRRLLVHPHHMTVTVEEYFGGPVAVRVLDRRRDGDCYARKIVLVHEATGRVVQFGIVRIRLGDCSEPVRAAILAEQTPLGRILIEHDVLRRIEPTAFFRTDDAAALGRWFGTDANGPTYGRLGIIHTDGRPAIELLELLAPVD